MVLSAADAAAGCAALASARAGASECHSGRADGVQDVRSLIDQATDAAERLLAVLPKDERRRSGTPRARAHARAHACVYACARACGCVRVCTRVCVHAPALSACARRGSGVAAESSVDPAGRGNRECPRSWGGSLVDAALARVCACFCMEHRVAYSAVASADGVDEIE